MNLRTVLRSKLLWLTIYKSRSLGYPSCSFQWFSNIDLMKNARLSYGVLIFAVSQGPLIYSWLIFSSLGWDASRTYKGTNEHSYSFHWYIHSFHITLLHSGPIYLTIFQELAFPLLFDSRISFFPTIKFVALIKLSLSVQDHLIFTLTRSQNIELKYGFTHFRSHLVTKLIDD